MDGKTHLMTGILIGASAIYAKDKLGIEIDPLDATLFITGAGVGALLPDADIETAPVAKFIPLWLLFDHRTYTHSFLFVGVVCLTGYILKAPYSLIYGLFAGVLSHLILDSLTPMGLPYAFYPISYQKVKGYKKRK